MLPKTVQGLTHLMDYIEQNDKLYNLRLLEIGSFVGASSRMFAERFGEVVCVDPWEITRGSITERYDMTNVEKRFDKIAKEYSNIKKVKNRIENVIDKLGKFDVIYIDGNHTYEAVRNNINQCLPLCKMFIAGHDYVVRFEGVIKAVNEIFSKPDGIFIDSSWIHKIRSKN